MHKHPGLLKHPNWDITDILHFELYSIIIPNGKDFVDWDYNNRAHYFWQLPPYQFEGIKIGIHNYHKWIEYDKLD